MASDRATEVLAVAKARFETVTDIGKVFVYTPYWDSLADLDKSLIRVSTTDKDEHRFVWIAHSTRSEPLAFGGGGCELVTHELICTMWVAAREDEDQFEKCTAEAIALKSAALAAFRDSAASWVMANGDVLTYEDDDVGPEEVGETEFRLLCDHLFHVTTLRIAPREEVDSV